jgi:NAD-dependent SIR2 family protein deacetylase
MSSYNTGYVSRNFDGEECERKSKRRKIQLPLTTVADMNYFCRYYSALQEVTWMCSHLDPEYIIWSSNPNILAPRLAFKSNDYVIEENTTMSYVPGACSLEYATQKASKLLHSGDYDKVLIIAGAGCSVDSTDDEGQKLPDYRTCGALWKRQVQSMNKTMEELDDPTLFESDPALVWGLFTFKLKLFLKAKPHAGYQRMLNGLVQDYFVMTSNVDGQFRRSGYKRVFECHGSLQRLQCVDMTCRQQIWDISEQEVEQLITQLDVQQLRLKNENDVIYPRCPTCKKIARPNVSMHGDTNLTYNEQVGDQQKSELQKWMNDLWQHDKKLLALEIGCGVSLHSLRVESDCLLNKNPKNTTLIRINNMDPCFCFENVISIQSSAADTLMSLFSP